MLGVHPTTLRRWADQGDILVMTTPGGHRRFPLSEIERLTGQGGTTSGSNEELVSSVLLHARQRLSSHATEGWLTRIKDSEKMQFRSMGREVLELMKTYLDESGGGEAMQARVEAVGTTYGEYTRGAGLSLGDLLEATSFFRDSTLESVVDELDTGAEGFKKTFRTINTFFNTLLVSASEPFDH